MNYLRQPKYSNLCGQTCIAMIAGLSLEQSIKLFNSSDCTTTKQLKQVLNICHINTGEKLERLKKEQQPYTTCILKITWGNKSHWVVYNKGKVYDPALGVFKYDKFKNTISGKITSQLKIFNIPV